MNSDFLQGLTTVLAVICALVIGIWTVTWHWPYVRLGLDIVLLVIWIAGLVAGIIRTVAVSANPVDLENTVKPGTIAGLLILIILEM
jgi:hypothetical protein